MTSAVDKYEKKKSIKRQNRSTIIPCSKSRRFLMTAAKQNGIKRVSAGACTLVTAAVEYIVSELCELCTEAAWQQRGGRQKKKSESPKNVRIGFSDVSLAIRSDTELNKLFSAICVMSEAPFKRVDKDFALLFDA